MELTEEQKMEVKDKFKQRRNKQLIISLPLIALILCFIFLEKKLENGALSVSPEAAGIAFFIVVIMAVVLSLKNWRCPACHKYLGKGINPKFCAKCGVELQ